MAITKESAENFVASLAEYLAGKNVARLSVLLQLGSTDAQQWAELRGQTSLFGYPNLEEAKEVLRRDLIAIGEALKGDK